MKQGKLLKFKGYAIYRMTLPELKRIIKMRVINDS